jgi:2-iminoacetate synthase
VNDTRSLDEIVHWLINLGYIPSFCTACYKEGRTGDRFMKLCKEGQILNCCHPNSLMTLKEYAMDYASPRTKELSTALIEKEIEKVPDDKVKKIVIENLRLISEDNRRDFRF